MIIVRTNSNISGVFRDENEAILYFNNLPHEDGDAQMEYFSVDFPFYILTSGSEECYALDSSSELRQVLRQYAPLPADGSVSLTVHLVEEEWSKKTGVDLPRINLDKNLFYSYLNNKSDNLF